MGIFEYIDMFGTTFSFTVKNQSRYKTVFGGILSILCLILVVIFSLFFGSDFFFRTNPRVVYESIVPENSTIVRVTNKNFTIAFRLTDLYGNIKNLKRVYPQLLYYQKIFNSTANKTEENITSLNFISCNDSSKGFDPVFLSTKGINPENWLCVDWEGYDYKMGGVNGGPEYYFISIGYINCNFNKGNNQCYNYTQIKGDIGISTNKIYFNVALPIFYFSPENYDNPLNYYYNIHNSQLSTNLVKTETLNYKSIFMDDDKGKIFSDITNYELMVFDSLSTDYYFRDDSEVKNVFSYQEFYTAKLDFVKQYNKYNRSYMKFQELCANVGGFMKIIMTVFSFLNFYFNKFSRDIFIINELFEYSDFKFSDKKKFDLSLGVTQNAKNLENSDVFDESKLNNKKIENSQIELVKTNNFMSFNNATYNCGTVQNKILRRKSDFALAKIPENTDLLKEEQKGQVSLNFINCKFLCYLISCRQFCKSGIKKRKVTFYDFSKIYLKERLDVTSYVKFHEQVERLKLFLLNYYQNLSLKYLKKPNILDEVEMKKLDIDVRARLDNHQQSKDKSELLAYYIQRIQLNQLDENDKYLLEMIEPSLRLAIEKQINA